MTDFDTFLNAATSAALARRGRTTEAAALFEEALALHALGDPAAALEASRRAERALATMDGEQWPGAGADYEALRNTPSGSGGAGGVG